MKMEQIKSLALNKAPHSLPLVSPLAHLSQPRKDTIHFSSLTLNGDINHPVDWTIVIGRDSGDPDKGFDEQLASYTLPRLAIPYLVAVSNVQLFSLFPQPIYNRPQN